MKYDFETNYNRRKACSSKWQNMDSRKENIGEGVVPLSVADMEFLTCPEIREELSNYVNSEILGYTEPSERYLDSVVEFFKEYHGYEGKKEWIVTTSGIVPALATTVRAFTNIGDEVIIFTPVYNPFYNVIKNQDRKILNCPLIRQENSYYIDYELLEKYSARESAKMILICNPHNPSGRVWSKEELLKIAEIASKNGLVVVSDEIHSDIALGDNKHTVYGSVSESAKNSSVVCTAASKTFNIAGLQCSNIFIANEDLRNKFVETNSNIGLGKTNILGMVATRAAYEKGQDWLVEAKNIIEKNNNIVKDFFDSYNGKFETMLPEASFLVWVNFENTGIKHEEFMKFLNEDAEFYVVDGTMFGENGENFIRINTGIPTKKLQESLERLKRKLNKKYSI